MIVEKWAFARVVREGGRLGMFLGPIDRINVIPPSTGKDSSTQSPLLHDHQTLAWSYTRIELLVGELGSEISD
jgi:hypothetical protein